MRNYEIEPLNSRDIDILNKQKTEYHNDKRYIKEEKFVFIHKTHYMPKNNQLKSKYSFGAMVSDYGYLFDERYDYKYLMGDNYIHFSINCEVKGNSSDIYGFNNRKYAVVIPGSEEVFRNIHHFHANDIEFEDTIDISNRYILCPVSEIEKVKANNPDVKVIPYIGEVVDGYAEAFASQLGYTIENIKVPECMWINSNTRTNEVLDKYGYQFIQYGMYRYYSEYKRQDLIKRTALFKKVLEIALEKDINIFDIFNDVENMLFRATLNALDFEYKVDYSKIKNPQERDFYKNTFGENCTGDENILIRTIMTTIPFEKVQEDLKLNKKK